MINAGVAGLGWWGRVLVEAVQGKSDGIRFTRGVVTTPSKSQDFADAHGFELGTDFDAMLGDDTIDAVVLATPHSLHRGQVEAAARAGKHVFCEKPLTLTAEDARAAAAAANKAGVVLGAGHNRRFAPAFAEMRRRVADGALGPVMHVEANMSAPALWMYKEGSWRLDREETPAGGLAGMGLHMIDGIISMFGPIAAVVAQSSRVHRTQGLDEMTSMLMRMENGMHAYIATSIATAWCFDFRVFGENGWAEIRNVPMDEFTFCPRDGEIERVSFEPSDNERAELEAFAVAVSGGPDYLVPVDEAVHSIEVFEAIIGSAEKGRWVELR